ncbi:MAG: phage tail tape measure protein [Phycisphaeraceae bacterium]
MAKSRSIRAGRAYVELGVEDRLTRGLRAAEQRLKQFGASVRQIGTRIAGIGAAVATPLLAATRSFANVGDDMQKMAARTGVGVEALSELGFAAEQSGASVEAMGNVLFRMRRRIANAATGAGPAVRAVDSLGLSAEQLTQLPVEQQFKVIADSLAYIANPSEAAQYAFEVLGDEAKAMLPLLAEGADGIEALQQQARDLGLTVTSDAAASAAKLSDQWHVMTRVMKAATFAIGEALAPAIGDVVERVSKALVIGSNWIRQNQQLIVVVLKTAAAVVGIGTAIIGLGLSITLIGTALGGLASIVSGVAAAFGLLAAAVTALVSPIGLASAAVVGLGGYLVHASESGGNALRWLADRFVYLRDTALRSYHAIADALAAGDISLAARVLWLTLRMEWQRGIAFLNRRWINFRFAFLQTFNDAMAGARAVWAETVAFFERTWTRFEAGRQRAIEHLGNTLARGWARLQSQFDETFDLNFALEHLDQQHDQQLREIARNEQRQQAAIEDRREQRMQGIVDDHAAALAGLRQQHDEELSQTGSALEKARREWEQAVTEARSAREAVGDDGPERLNPATDLFDAFDDIVNRLHDVARDTVQVRGTFNVAAVQSLQASSTDERIADAAEQTARNTKRIERNMNNNNGGLAFT